MQEKRQPLTNKCCFTTSSFNCLVRSAKKIWLETQNWRNLWCCPLCHHSSQNILTLMWLRSTAVCHLVKSGEYLLRQKFCCIWLDTCFMEQSHTSDNVPRLLWVDCKIGIITYMGCETFISPWSLLNWSWLCCWAHRGLDLSGIKLNGQDS